MRILKRNPILMIINSYLVDSPQPSTISYLWNFGSLLGLCLVSQIFSGILLAMHYQGSASFAFLSVEHIMRDVQDGWLIRMVHANIASFFFICVYLHISRGLYYGSYRSPRIGVWVIGTIIFFLMMGTAFLGKYHCPKWSKIYIKRKISKDNNILFNKIQRRYYLTNNNYSKNNKSNNNNNSYSNNNNYSNITTNFIKEKKLNPVYIYEDLNLEEKKRIIIKDTKGLSGIYLILNKITLDYYIGSASTNKFYAKFSNHLIHKRGSKIVKHAITEYGLSNFAFLILELFPDIVNKINNKNLLNIEDFYLKSLLPNYNIITEAGSNFGYRHTEISRIKIKSVFSQKRRDKIEKLGMYKYLYNENTNTVRLIERNLPWKNPESEDTLLFLFDTEDKRWILRVFNLNGTVYDEYFTKNDAVKSLKCSVKTISRTLRSRKKILKKRWKLKLVII